MSWHSVLCVAVACGICLPAQAQTRPDGPLDELFQLKNRKTSRLSSANRQGNNTDWIVIAPGETKTLAEIPGAGVIRRFYVAPLAADRMRYRKAVLRMYWDGGKVPCVEVPLGDFFGSGLGTLRYFHSVVVDINPGYRGADFDGLASYFPMPFERGARITLENDGNVSDYRLWYHIDVEHYASGELPPESGRFHAQWRREAHTRAEPGGPRNSTGGNAAAENTTGAGNYVILDAEGRGNYVGLFLTVDNLAGGWYGEGDDMIYVDGATAPPTYAGTGHEEVFNSGCCPDAEFWGQYTGFYLIENRNGNFGGKNLMYRFYVNDPIRFQKSIRVTIEHGHANNFENDYTSTAFWYQQEPHKLFPAMPGPVERLPSWPEGVQQAMDRELKLGQELSTLMKEKKIRISDEDRKHVEALSKERMKSFRELRYADFLRGVQGLESTLKRYTGQAP
jgi:Protein of unknown function (DUF2961)